MSKTGSWGGIIARMKDATEEKLERIAAMDQPNVQPLMTADALMKRIREYNNRLVAIEAECSQLEVEHERVRTEMVRLQTQFKTMFSDHMQGWEVQARLLNPLREPRQPAINVEPVQS
jgi:predicted nuclease with TOPRIM domain